MSLSNILKITGRLMIPRLFCLEPFSLYSQYKVVLVCFEIDGNWLVPMLLLKKLKGIGFKNVSVFSKLFTGISVFWIAFLVFKFVIPVMAASNWTFPCCIVSIAFILWLHSNIGFRTGCEILSARVQSHYTLVFLKEKVI